MSAQKKLNFNGIVLGTIPANYTDQTGKPLQIIEALSRVNMFVGTNNSGKSMLLRHLAHAWNGDIVAGPDYQTARTSFKQEMLELQALWKRANHLSKSLKLNKLENLPEYDNIKTIDRFPDIRSVLTQFLKGEISTGPSSTFRVQPPHQIPLAATALSALKHLDAVDAKDAPHHCYIPSLRGLRPPSGDSDAYSVRTTADYGIARTKIFTGLDMYVRVRKMLLGDIHERKLISDYERFLSLTFFESQDISLIPREHDGNDVIYVKIGSEDERPIYSLGDGIQSIIILTFLPHTTGGFFYVEEPETHLHPGLQRKLLKYYTTTDNACFFMTTHSNHLLELTADLQNISVFTLRKNINTNNGNFTLSKASAGDFDTLHLLGVRAASVFLANCTIWVEGITDRWFFRNLLQMYIKSERRGTPEKTEDIHFAFIEYGGGNITHWSFLEKEDHPMNVSAICSKLFLIVDHDGERKSERLQSLRDNLDDRLLILPCRELENLLPPAVLVNTVAEICRIRPAEISAPQWDDYRNEKIGDYLDNKLLSGAAPKKRLAAESGTIKDKRNFWDVALRHFQNITFDDLQNEVQDIARRLYRFIEEQNS